MNLTYPTLRYHSPCVFFLYCACFSVSGSNANFCVFVLWVFLSVAETRVVQYTRTVTVRISHFTIRMDCKTRVRSVKSCLRSENCISLVGRRIFHGERGYIRFVDLYGSYRSQISRTLCSDVIMRCTLRLCAEYGLLVMLTVCIEERTIRRLLLTVRNSAAVLDMTGRRGGNLESKFCWQGRVRNPIPGVQNPQRGIQNPCLSLITLYGAMRHLVIAPVQNIKKPFFRRLEKWKMW